MPLVEQIVQVNIEGGLDEGTDPRLVVPPRLTVAKNARWPKRGVTDKRYGYSRIGASAGPTTGKRLAKRGDELLVSDGTDLWSYSSKRTRFFQRDRVTPVSARRDDIIADAAGFSAHDVARANGYEVYIWISLVDGHPYAMVIDEVTRGVVLGPTDLSPGAIVYDAAMLLFEGTEVYAVYSTQAGPAIRGRRLDMTTPTAWSAEVLLSTGAYAGSGPVFAAALTTTNLFIFFPTAVVNIAVERWNRGLSASVGAAFATGSANAVLSMWADGIAGERIWVAYNNTPGPGLRAFAINDALAQVVAHTTVNTTALGTSQTRTCILRTSATEALVMGSDALVKTVWRRINSAAALGAERRAYWVRLSAAPFIGPDSRVYCGLMTDTALSQSEVLVDLNADDTSTVGLGARPVAILATRNLRDLVYYSYSPPQHVVIGASSTKLLSTVSINADNAGRAGVSRVLYDFADPLNIFPSELGDVTGLSGGLATQWDGNKVTELGFLYPPTIVALTFGGGTAIATGNYNYKVTYAYVDASGRLHESAPSAVAGTINPGGLNSVNIEVRMLSLTLRQEHDALAGITSPIYILVYRTKGGAGAQGGPFYRVTVEPWPAANLNDTNVASITINDTSSDATIGAHATLYTDGDVVENVCPPSIYGLITHGDRFLAIGDTRREIWFTEEAVPPNAPAWHDEFTIPIAEGGDITALASFDSTIIAFKENCIYRITGQGPLPTLASNDFSAPQRIVQDSGCVDPRSIVRIPAGLIYRDPNRGFMLLTRSLETRWIGEDVQNIVRNLPIVSSVSLIATEHVVVFTMLLFENSTSIGTMLAYDYERDRWAEWTMDTNAGADPAALSAVEYQGKHTYFAGWGACLQQDRETFLDNGAFVTLDLQLGAFSLAGLQGYQRVWRVQLRGSQNSFHGLSIEVITDETDSVTSTWTDVDINGLSLEQVRVSPKNQKCAQMAVRVKDIAPATLVLGTGQGPTLIGLALRVGVLKGTRQRLAANAKR